jgi:endonuclease YncB( thermonuclease family)
MTRRHRHIGWLAGVAALVAAGCGNDERPLASGPQPPSIAYRVWVLGGDGLVVDGQHIRLSNAHAPESVPQARCWAEGLASKFAIQKVKAMVREARTIEVTPTGGRDEYNRVYARVSLDGLDLGTSLVEQGLAATPPKGRFEWCNPISLGGEGAPDWHAFGENGRP